MNGYHFRLAYGLVGSSNGMVGLGAFPTYVTYAGTAPWGSLHTDSSIGSGTGKGRASSRTLAAFALLSLCWLLHSHEEFAD